MTNIADPHEAEVNSATHATALAAQINRLMEAAVQHRWEDNRTGRQTALGLMKEFAQTATALECLGWSAERIQAELAPSRAVFALSPFMRRCQQWPRGRAGDYETIEYLFSSANQGDPASIGWHFEEIILGSPVAQQHRNKLDQQSVEIARTVLRNRHARILSVACGGCLDWVQILPALQDFQGEIVLNDCDPAALALAESRLRQATDRVRPAPGNVLRIAPRLSRGPRFDLVVAGGLFDYLNDKVIVFLLRSIYRDLLAPGGTFLFTNIAKGNPWRPLMEHGSNWTLIERSESEIRELCREAGLEQSAVSLRRESTGLTILTRVHLQ